MVTSRGAIRSRHRYWLLVAIAFSALMWFAIINLGRTGHTKILRSGEIIAHHAHATAAKARQKARKSLGAPPSEPR